MTEFKNVTAVKKANIFFNGNVTSRTIILENGSKKTLGIMLPGEYEFNTSAPEVMDIMSGELDLLLNGEQHWRSIKGGESFNVPENSSFKVKVKSLTDYCCSFG
ncbi:MAG: pyrimidine/purine nucleoside phosphorylase [Nitrospirae bacterium]|nr:pyrimidine/purine nucleoside phosphorylase [Nitrospirota bacterium]